MKRPSLGRFRSTRSAHLAHSSGQMSLAMPSTADTSSATPIYAQCNARGIYDKNVDTLDCLYGTHNWTIASITLAYTQQGYHWGIAVRIPSLTLEATQHCSYGTKPVSSRYGAICAAKTKIAHLLQQWGSVHPIIKQAPEYQHIIAWLYQQTGEV